MSYDPKCYNLAEAFLDDTEVTIFGRVTEQHREKLAQGIQDYIEDFLEDLEYDRQQELEAARDKAAEDKMDERRLDGK